MQLLKGSALTISQERPASCDRRWTFLRSSPLMSYSSPWPAGGQLEAVLTSGGARGRPASGPVARVNESITLASGIVHSPHQQV